ncbi:Arachidonate 5-lipoxygenase [Triplophysa tibetana]|uniref:Arachidonate 5-lipoxygenase n=1 Tax=Triplophysa tibetana TaxID=1572043 RepID=A0A5A9PKN7_9TELE|nr:Arachidonate 5-lipoxygenase [Triplophysa tibetana]
MTTPPPLITTPKTRSKPEVTATSAVIRTTPTKPTKSEIIASSPTLTTKPNKQHKDEEMETSTPMTSDEDITTDDLSLLFKEHCKRYEIGHCRHYGIFYQNGERETNYKYHLRHGFGVFIIRGTSEAVLELSEEERIQRRVLYFILSRFKINQLDHIPLDRFWERMTGNRSSEYPALSPEACVEAKKQYKVLVSNNGDVSHFSLTLVDSNNRSRDTSVKKTFSWFGKEINITVDVEKDFGDIVQVFSTEYKSTSATFVQIVEAFINLFFNKQPVLKMYGIQIILLWKQSRAGFPQNLDAELKDLPLDVQFDKEKSRDFNLNAIEMIVAEKIDLVRTYFESWNELKDFYQIFLSDIKKTLLVNVMEDWNTDYMFGYQFLNGCNPVMIRKCVELPKTFPVTHKMVEGSLSRGRTLQQELKDGNIYIVDYKILDGLKPNKTSQNIQYFLTAPICLLYKNRLDQIVPIAIQLSQKPGESSPIFLPNDNEYDWMLAKMWVKSSDFNVHQLVTHLLKTHLISEVFEVAMYRQLSTVHPVYKLLIPHVRFTIGINAEARANLISQDGVFSKISSISAEGIDELMKRAMETFTYKSMCFPEAIKERGMENTPNYYYRDDGMKIWNAINCFVDKVIEIYYDSDEAVVKDVEIQKFVEEVSKYGMKDSKGDKFPQSLKTREELAKYLTAVIFTASAQHAAVNFGQFEWYGCIPNSPSTMRKPPPQEKDTVDLDYIMDTLPDRHCSIEVLGTVWDLTRFQGNERYLGMFPDMYFTEQPVKQAIMTFRKELEEVTDIIKCRNEGLTMSYCYLSPEQIPNSVAI